MDFDTLYKYFIANKNLLLKAVEYLLKLWNT